MGGEEEKIVGCAAQNWGAACTAHPGRRTLQDPLHGFHNYGSPPPVAITGRCGSALSLHISIEMVN